MKLINSHALYTNNSIDLFFNPLFDVKAQLGGLIGLSIL
jgi:hypothetical protein